MQFLRLTGSTADTFLEYIQRNLPEGVAMKVTKAEITAMPSHIRTPDEPQQLALSSSMQESSH
jgi:small subunit ribosomal protein S10